MKHEIKNLLYSDNLEESIEEYAEEKVCMAVSRTVLMMVGLGVVIYLIIG